jgi:hypothetical protein
MMRMNKIEEDYDGLDTERSRGQPPKRTPEANPTDEQDQGQAVTEAEVKTVIPISFIKSQLKFKFYIFFSQNIDIVSNGVCNMLMLVILITEAFKHDPSLSSVKSISLIGHFIIFSSSSGLSTILEAILFLLSLLIASAMYS